MQSNRIDSKLKPVEVLTLEKNEAVLRTKSKDIPLNQISTPEFKEFLKVLYLSMMNAPLKPNWMAAGISAIQIGEPLNLFYAYNGNADTYDIFINPQIKLLGDTTDIKEESCLSIPEIEGVVRRHKRVKISYLDINGTKQIARYSGWNARIIQHEGDHLQGVLFIDKLEEA